MDYARRFQVWGNGMLIAFGFIVVILAFGSHLTFGVILLILVLAGVCIWLNTRRLNRKYGRADAQRNAGKS